MTCPDCYPSPENNTPCDKHKPVTTTEAIANALGVPPYLKTVRCTRCGVNYRMPSSGHVVGFICDSCDKPQCCGDLSCGTVCEEMQRTLSDSSHQTEPK